MFILTLTTSISSAHRIPEHPGKCRHLHGHNYRIDAKFQNADATKLMIARPQLISILQKVTDPYDHVYLNELSRFEECSTTAEYISQVIFEDLQAACQSLAPLQDITVWETNKYNASYSI